MTHNSSDAPAPDPDGYKRARGAVRLTEPAEAVIRRGRDEADYGRAKPRLLDLFCGAGGAAMGYARAGFDVVGVDIVDQPNYPFEFERADALQFLFVNLRAVRSDFDAIHASPPCQAYSDLKTKLTTEYSKLIEPLRSLLQSPGLPYIIENVEGAPLDDPIVLCGTMFRGLRVLRHRLFESNFRLTTPPHTAKHPLVFTHDKRKAHYGKLDQDTSFVQVTGGGNCTVENARRAMGIDWMTKGELNEAIPPAYTEWVGLQLRMHLAMAKEAA